MRLDFKGYYEIAKTCKYMQEQHKTALNTLIESEKDVKAQDWRDTMIEVLNNEIRELPDLVLKDKYRTIRDALSFKASILSIMLWVHKVDGTSLETRLAYTEVLAWDAAMKNIVDESDKARVCEAEVMRWLGLSNLGYGDVDDMYHAIRTALGSYAHTSEYAAKFKNFLHHPANVTTAFNNIKNCSKLSGLLFTSIVDFAFPMTPAEFYSIISEKAESQSTQTNADMRAMLLTADSLTQNRVWWAKRTTPTDVIKELQLRHYRRVDSELLSDYKEAVRGYLDSELSSFPDHNKAVLECLEKYNPGGLLSRMGESRFCAMFTAAVNYGCTIEEFRKRLDLDPVGVGINGENLFETDITQFYDSLTDDQKVSFKLLWGAIYEHSKRTGRSAAELGTSIDLMAKSVK